MYCYFLAFLLACAVNAWLPQDHGLTAFNQSVRFEKLGKRFEPHLPNGITKIRGVNFGGWLIAEPWLMEDEWRAMGCDPDHDRSEFDCMLNHYMGNNRKSGNDAFKKHWEQWTDANTVQSVYDVGLNTIRIPIGYWSYTEIVDKTTEPFANGDNMLPYLDNVVQRATELGMYVIIDLHGAPGAQQQDAFTGQLPNQAGFFDDYNFDRACKWLTWMTNRIHSHPAYASVGMIGVLNEPVSMHDPNNRYPAPGEVPGLVETYYPRALKAVRDAEMEVPEDRKLHVQFMSRLWDSGDPRASSSVRNDPMVAFDDHNYIGFIPTIAKDEYSLMHNACTGSRLVDGENFKITGEWSMVSEIDWHNVDFFKKFFTAQQQLYEKPGMDGWIFWTWKTELNNPRWTYSYATFLNYIPSDAIGLENNVYRDVCAGYR